MPPKAFIVTCCVIVALVIAHVSSSNYTRYVGQYWKKGKAAVEGSGERANAAFIILARESECRCVEVQEGANKTVYGLIQSIGDVEDRFNRRYHYPYVILNEENFSDRFKEHVSAVASSQVHFGKIQDKDWVEPPFIDQEKAKHERETARYMYGDSVSYRRMCHYQSGGFYKHPLMRPYDYYWRVEPNIGYFCDINYDPFAYMAENNKSYGWTMAFNEFPDTIRTLWPETQKFIEGNPQHIAANNALTFLSKDNGKTYTGAHFWSNMEIGSLTWLRSEAYTDYFDHLDKSGGFFYERWGDAPVHSIAAALLLDKNQIHWFNDIGYQHDDKMNCPADSIPRGCRCNPAQSWERHWREGLDAWQRVGAGN